MAENPENHKQAIQQGINHPADQYGSVSNAVETLEKSGFIISRLAKSQKNNKIKLFRCTDVGVLYSLARNPSCNIPKVLDANKEEVEFCKQFRALYNVWGKKHMTLFLKELGEFLPMVHAKGIDYATPYLIMKFVKLQQALDPKTKKNNVKEAMSQFPNTKKMLKEMRKNIDGLL